MARTGRPRCFDRNDALEKALLLFWVKGYESTSLAQLKACMGDISAPSFYAAFGSKEALFAEVLARYLATHGRVMDSLRDEQLAPREAVNRALHNTARMQTERDHPPGCLLILSATTCPIDSQALQKVLADDRKRTWDGLRSCIQKAIDAGELSSATEADALATLFQTCIQGLTIQAREGADYSALGAVVDQVMRVWDYDAMNAQR
ncbi:TetR/AcrR family transcriptional regulator [Pseudomonas sp.]|uniref:TetR/AcrR family transcriptional regulator n=1 Tax=Pseudomonas sp. TaxID=306 RepID=UPI0026042E77|nr:TetR/AcrR family transcriptional regulator [Pseudomonas sp.]